MNLFSSRQKEILIFQTAMHTTQLIIYLIDQFMIEMWNFQLLDTATSLKDEIRQLTV